MSDKPSHVLKEQRLDSMITDGFESDYLFVPYKTTDANAIEENQISAKSSEYSSQSGSIMTAYSLLSQTT